MNEMKPGLPRLLGPWIALAVVVGTVIGSGVFVKPRQVAQHVPDFALVALVWTVCGVFTLLGALALAEVSVLFPLAGGNYVFLRNGYGRFAGFLWGWVEFWMIRAASIAALATVFVGGLDNVVRTVAGQSQPWLSDVMRVGLAIGVIVILAGVNIRGVRWGGGLQFVVTLVKVFSLLAILVLPFALVGLGDPEGIRVALLNQPEVVPFSWSGLGIAFFGVLFAYHGWMNVAPIAGEITRPQRNIPIAFLGGVGIVLFLYLGANLAYCLTLTLEEMKNLPQGDIVAAEFCRRLLGDHGAALASAAIMVSTFGALNGNMLVGPRLLYAMGEDALAPRWLSSVHVQFQTPAAATAVLAAWTAVLLIVGYWAQRQFTMTKSLFDMMTDFAMFGAIIFETLAVATIFVFRRRLPDAERPYRCPLYPWIPLAYLALPAFVLFTMFIRDEERMQSFVGLGVIGFGALVYWVWQVQMKRAA